MTWDPVRTIEIQGQRYPILQVGYNSGTATNHQLVAAVSGSIVRVMGLIAQSTGAVEGNFQFKSNSGGTVILHPIIAPLPTITSPFFMPIVETGYTETTVGHGLFLDVVTDTVNLNVFYISYVP